MIVPDRGAIPMGGLLVLLAIAGCSEAPASVEGAKPPRPVSTMVLGESSPSVPSVVTAAVVSWKTEQLAFEVGGRVSQVIEPNERVEPKVDSEGGEPTLGTPLARLEDERFRIAVEADRAAVEVARRQIEAVRVDLEQRLPARIDAARAEEQLARIELERARRLTERSAGTRSALDQAETTLATAAANLAAAEGELAAREAELRSLEAQRMQAEQRLARAERDLADVVLFSPFRGQVAESHVTPGAFVQAGDPIATVQMMDPVAVEFEVSAEDSRRFRRWDTLSVLVEDGKGRPRSLDGVVYRTSAVADPKTRTFTVTLLVRNPIERPQVPDDLTGGPIARASAVVPLNVGSVVGGQTGLFADEASIGRDEDGPFLWRVTNRRLGESSIGDAGILRVEKLRIATGSDRVPFLGAWTFVPIEIVEGQAFDPERDLVVVDLTVTDGDRGSWDGETVLLEQDRWLLRPGDVVRVDLGGEANPTGFYVPMKALRRESGRTFAFVVDEEHPDQPTARQVEVFLPDRGATFLGPSTLHRVEPVEPGRLAEGDRLIIDGVHYLTDGDAILEIQGRSGGVR
ncbi:efflux RND transporter periplasmic adaptor subunit [Tautonia marina]|uniref:efflux RND transporter periplasmic adaptor subunit n=1 Tax=Tautonia marina TaxID=2653855 RepID=UPI001375E49F|nr:HlyD family efflux transporter periplasmic adaptor subunit [Tautonia marina]